MQGFHTPVSLHTAQLGAVHSPALFGLRTLQWVAGQTARPPPRQLCSAPEAARVEGVSVCHALLRPLW